VQCEAAAIRLHGGARDRQSQARTAGTAAPRSVDSVKAVENPIAMFLWDSGATVDDVDMRLRNLRDDDGDLGCSWTVLDRVVQ
jgi:hypothetical protein